MSDYEYSYKEVELSTGVVMRVDELAILYGYEMAGMLPELRLPPVPMQEVKEGKPPNQITRTVEMPKENKEYKDWEAECERINTERDRYQQNLPWEDGIIAWRLPDDDEWRTEPPKDYVVPRTMKRMMDQEGGWSPYLDNRRIAYVRFVLLRNPADTTKIMQSIYAGAPLTTTEVDAATEGFRS